MDLSLSGDEGAMDFSYIISDSDTEVEADHDKCGYSVLSSSDNECNESAMHVSTLDSSCDFQRNPFHTIRHRPNRIVDSDDEDQKSDKFAESSIDSVRNDEHKEMLKAILNMDTHSTNSSDCYENESEECQSGIPENALNITSTESKTKNNAILIDSDSASSEEGSSEDSVALNLAAHEVGVGNMDTHSTNSSDCYENESEECQSEIPENTLNATSTESKTKNNVILIDSDSASSEEGSSEGSSEDSVALNLAAQEVGVGNIDPLVAQKRALVVCRIQKLQGDINKAKYVLESANIKILPDRGEKLQDIVITYEEELKQLQMELENTPLVQPTAHGLNLTDKEALLDFPTSHLEDEDLQFIANKDITTDLHLTNEMPTTLPNSKILGKRAQETQDRERALTMERLEELHGSLVDRPSEKQIAEDPKGLKVNLMLHQQQALAWLLWRERQRPAGGILADDMGLGKTLTMISLIMTTLANKSIINPDENSDDEWGSSRSRWFRGGTLVVCPASLLVQWESEIKNRTKRGILTVQVYHGSHRENVPARLARHNVVITTYNILIREVKNKSTLYQINWQRVILDEAHVIRNYKSQMSEAACAILATKRWALTGTPVHNKKQDLYAILKFLKCSPFDDLRVWKRWVDNKNVAGQHRLAAVLKTLMLRRTKQELQETGALESLPEKYIEDIEVKLDPEEQLVYEKILVYSRTLFAQFLHQKAEKLHVNDLNGGIYDKPTFLSNPNKQTQFSKAQSKLLALHADVQTYEILMLILRLRQICCYPGLLRTMIDKEDMARYDLTDDEIVDSNFLTEINNITLNENDEETLDDEDIGIDSRVTANILSNKNPVFDSQRVSSKLRAALSMVKEILQTKDKVIIVSQWTSMLDVVASHLSTIENATYKKFTGSVAVKDRPGIIESFNNPTGNPRVLLLSLTAGGVGLNLVGGNHLLFLDIHWNPQLEKQAEDRIYRFGQIKNVHIYKFICTNTIEERIKQLQEHKLEIAGNVLSGDSPACSGKLTLDDLKTLFAL